MRQKQALILASSSPYRAALLDRLRIPYSIATPEIDEASLAGEAPQATAQRLAVSKARAVAGRYTAALVIGSDQVAVVDGIAVSKPGTREGALAQLATMRARRIVFHTALCLLDTGADVCQVESVPTTITFRDYSDAEAQRYVDAEPAYDCAGSAKIEAFGIVLVEKIESTDPTAIVGLPLIALVTMLRRAGVQIP